VAMNFSVQPQTVHYDLGGAGKLRTLASSYGAPETASAAALALPPLGAYVGAVR